MVRSSGKEFPGELVMWLRGLSIKLMAAVPSQVNPGTTSMPNLLP